MKNFKIALYILFYILFGVALYQLGVEEGPKYVFFPLLLGHIVIFLVLKEKLKDRKEKKMKR